MHLVRICRQALVTVMCRHGRPAYADRAVPPPSHVPACVLPPAILSPKRSQVSVSVSDIPLYPCVCCEPFSCIVQAILHQFVFVGGCGSYPPHLAPAWELTPT